MRDDIKFEKQQKIEQAAYDLLEQHGYGGISMLKIAKRAKASNETLYNWYGDKKGLFRRLVENNAEHVKELLNGDLEGKVTRNLETLDTLGPRLLDLVVGDRAVALNRAAAGDQSGELGAALAKSGRDAVVPLIESVFEQIVAGAGDVTLEPSKLAELYLRLLIGDLQIRRATGSIAKPSKAEITKRSGEAKELIQQMLVTT